jgi:hypothetical protein
MIDLAWVVSPQGSPRVYIFPRSKRLPEGMAMGYGVPEMSGYNVTIKEELPLFGLNDPQKAGAVYEACLREVSTPLINIESPKKDPTRPLSGQPMVPAEIVAAELAKHDLNTFTLLNEFDGPVVQAVRAMNTMGEADKADHLLEMVRAGHVRAGPIEGFLATTTRIDAQENIILSPFEQELSLIHEIGATNKFNLSHEENTAREKAGRRLLNTIEGGIVVEIDIRALVNTYGTIGQVPVEFWDFVAALGTSTIWLKCPWQESPLSYGLMQKYSRLHHEVLP